MSIETGWLIEFNDAGRPKWFCPNGTFSDDSLKALRFARKEDAEAFLIAGFCQMDDDFTTASLFYPERDSYCVTEHEWSDYGRD